ncbi:MAG: hypothetical protein ACD_21C00266G0003 [uncultured bacterium]|nr:MAG: hypothetical protein ACD_21C00266G0003 [uncultured bacterium]
MLTISTIKNTGGAAKYYSKEDNYYLSEVDAKEESLWIGDGATRLGVSGKVEERALHDLLNGKLPNGRIIGLQKDGTINHRAGYDLCFQAPKSVSILALDGGDRRLYEAHVGAIKETVKIIERDCAQAKVFRNEKISFENTRNLTIALIAHTTSRKLDLHLHHHALVMNFTQRQDATWRALASSKISKMSKTSKMKSDQINGFFERIHKNQIYYGLIYKTSLANKIVQLGHEIETVGPHGMWEIKGVPKEAREIMSKRRQEIENKIKGLNYRSLKAADVVTLNTREKKPSNINLNEIKQIWKNELASVGFSSKDYIAEIDINRELNKELNKDLNTGSRDTDIVTINPVISTNAKEAVHDAIEHLSQYNLKLDYTKIAALALEFSVGNTTHKEIIHVLDEVIQKGEIIPLDKSDSLFVTKALIETEKTIMDLVGTSKESGYPIKFKNRIIDDIDDIENRITNKADKTDKEVKESAVKILQSKSRIHLIEHMAADNTEFLSSVLKLAEVSGKTVRVLSPNRMLTNDINENIKRKPNGLWQWLVSLGKPEVGECLAGFNHKYKEEADLPFLGLRQGKDVLIVNNAETLGSSDMKSLLELTAKTSARVIFLRDTSIRQGFSAGNSMETLKQAGIETITFSSDSSNNSKFEKVNNHIPELKIIQNQNDDERTKELARTFALKEDNERGNTLVLVGARFQIKKTNEAIRDELKNLGKLSRTEHKVSVLNPVYLSKTESNLAHKYQKDMVIRFYNKGKIHEDWSVESNNRENNTLRLRFDDNNSSSNGSISNSANSNNSDKKVSRKTWNPKHGTDYRIFKREILGISRGDNLIATAKMNGLGINNTDRFIVTEVNESYVRLSDTTNITKTTKISLKDFQNKHFDYNYATTLGKYSQKKTKHIIADFRAYALDKPTLNDLNLRAKESLIIFTSDAKTIQNRFGFTPTKITAAEAVLDASKIDRYINDKTIDEIKGDIELAISTLIDKDSSAAKKAVDFAIDKITSRTAGFTHKELVAEALTYALKDQMAVFGKEVTHEEVMRVITEKRKSGELVMGRYFEDGTRWTTKEILTLERSIIENLKSGKDKLEPLLDKDRSSKIIENTKLTQDQKNACHLVITTKDQFVIIQGYAGTGKTTMFAQVQSMLENMDITTDNNQIEIKNQKTDKNKEIIEPKETSKMLALAPTHRAVRELKDIGITAQTLKSFLVEQQNIPATSTNPNNLNNKIIVLDEASMVSNKDFDGFLRLVNSSKVHVVLSGDIAQHIAIESGKPFEIAQKLGILKTAYLKEIVRQKNPILKDAVESVIRGDYSSAFEKIANENPQNHIKRLDTIEETKEIKEMKEMKRIDETKEVKKDNFFAPFASFAFFAALKSSIVEVDNNKLKSNEKNGKNKKNEKTLEQRIAEDYLSRAPETRDQTVVIVHANRDRRVITDIIRDGLKDQGEIDKKGMAVNCLIPKGLTNTEHKPLSSYNIGDVIKLGKEYYHVVTKEPTTKSILLKDEAGKTRYFYPEKQADRHNTELYEHTKEEIAVGDTIRLTKTDKERERYANFEYKVEVINNNAITLSSKDKDAENKQLILRPEELRDAHWDYAQTVTGYGIQGGSKTYAIDFEVSYRKNLANQRSFYIGASRAVQHLAIYTDNKEKLLNRILTNKGDKYSALEVVGDIDRSNNNKNKTTKTLELAGSIYDQQANSQIDNQTENNFTNSGSGKFLREFYDTKDIVEIEKSVKALAEVFVERILGQPNQKLSTATQWRYGNKGSLAIKMSGDKKGLWHNFETGESGNLISLIKKETGLSFKETLQYATNMPGIVLPVAQKEQLDKVAIDEKNNTKIKDIKTKDYAIALARESLPISGTVVEKYLKEIRGIKNIDSTDIRYHPKVYTGKEENPKYLPAMLSIGRDKNGQIKCVQATYLDPKTANKADVDIKKRTYASPSEAAVLLQKSNDKNKTSYITEGVETGLSIKDAVKHGDVFATLGKSNFTTLDPTKLGQKIVFCLDNDGKSIYNDEIIYKAAQRLINLGKDIFISVPNQINNQKTDFNDVARTNGTKAVEHYLNNIKSYDKIDKKIERPNNFYKNYNSNIKSDVRHNKEWDSNLQKADKHEVKIIDKNRDIPTLNQKEVSLNNKRLGFERDL